HQELVELRVADPTDMLNASAAGGATTPRDTNGEHCWIADWPWLRRVEDLRTASSSTASEVDDGGLMEMRGRAHIIGVEDACLAGIADVRERLARLRDPAGSPPPWPVRRAARLTRLLAELPTPTGDYDRIAPRYGGRTLRRLL